MLAASLAQAEKRLAVPKEILVSLAIDPPGVEPRGQQMLPGQEPGPLRTAPDIGGVDRELVKRRVFAVPVRRLRGEVAVEALVADKQGDTPVAAASRREGS